MYKHMIRGMGEIGSSYKSSTPAQTRTNAPCARARDSRCNLRACARAHRLCPVSAGIYFQLWVQGFELNFPFNIILLPLRIAEWFLR